MIFTSENKILTVNGKAIEKKINTLTFEVWGNQFPTQHGAGNTGNFILSFNKPQNLLINYGDGNVVTYNNISTFRIDAQGGSTLTPYVYQDGFDGRRLITFQFDNILELKSFSTQYINIGGMFPQEIGYAKNLTSINLRTVFFETFPNSIGKLRDINTLILRLALLNESYQIPEGIFENPISVLTLEGAYILEDHISSNLFKIDAFKETLTNLTLQRAKLKTLPEEVGNCYNIKDLRIDFNEWTKFPDEQTKRLTELEWLQVGENSYSVSDNTCPDFRTNTKLKTLIIRISNLDFSEIPVKWTGLISLANLNSLFLNFIDTNERFDEFIGYFYTLCTVNGSIVANGSPEPRPNRFRNISWGSSSLRFTGAKVAPSGYVQGVSNGTPATPGQRAYVLQNQYNHTITHGTPL